ncbi:hypothetical protein SERLADRAFT_443889 [Serpula lacrymans var. lacrymans S7.9]|uniref:Uncharacterized protein n=1 Tax=Serpula lacrymans var. lacrymans (strain S7.9) TaxID=578457 RepID=F8PDV3_SERL9|nr:uncharacterized protein SERLADRAFT_443889 [Serpula lacrymans var. lacrymans S7.9]EGO18550.1 hypothetical protein SERLADRAFT_443889 [Serpula lacrymans var. lacrymans S7.9]
MPSGSDQNRSVSAPLAALPIPKHKAGVSQLGVAVNTGHCVSANIPPAAFQPAPNQAYVVEEDSDVNDQTSETEGHDLDDTEDNDSKPPNGASSTELREALDAAHLQMAELRLQMCKLATENSSLHASLSNWKSTNKAPVEITMHKKQIAQLGKKYGVMVEPFIETSIFTQQQHEGVDYQSVLCYDSPLTEKLALASQLHDFILSPLHLFKAHSYFAEWFISNISSGRSTLIHNIRTHASVIFVGYNPEYFAAAYKRDNIHALQTLLKFDTMSKMDPLFPPILFPDFKKDMKRVFKSKIIALVLKLMLLSAGSLQGAVLFAAVIVEFLVSPDSNFHSVGDVSGIVYGKKFYEYKKLLICKSNTITVCTLFKYLNFFVFGPCTTHAQDTLVQEGDDFTNDLEDAMLAFDESESKIQANKIKAHLTVPAEGSISALSDLDSDTNLAENGHHWQVEASVFDALPIHPTPHSPH